MHILIYCRRQGTYLWWNMYRTGLYNHNCNPMLVHLWVIYFIYMPLLLPLQNLGWYILGTHPFRHWLNADLLNFNKVVASWPVRSYSGWAAFRGRWLSEVWYLGVPIAHFFTMFIHIAMKDFSCKGMRHWGGGGSLFDCPHHHREKQLSIVKALIGTKIKCFLF